MAKGKGIQIATREGDYARWYLDIIKIADLAEHGVVKGTMIIRPYGYAIWERMQRKLDDKFKDTGHENAYFPLFIPKSFLSKEASHVKGFAKEVAVVTHHRLIDDPDGDGVIVDPAAKLEEEVIVRPTSETIIYEAYSRWINSYRDLPVMINQWANVVRWEMRTRLFLRSSEFLWQEGHTAHATLDEAEAETVKMLDVYADFAENHMAMPVLRGSKPEHDKFPGALRTYAIEAMMQDKKSLQAGTSHNLGQNFAKAFDVKFTDADGKEQYVWQTSWGVSTRLIGGLIMSHSDDKGLVLPPRIAPYGVVIVPIWRNAEDEQVVRASVDAIRSEFQAAGIRIKLDDRDNIVPGLKLAEWEQKGVPLRMEIGPRDIAEGHVMLARRDTSEKLKVSREGLVARIAEELDAMQQRLFDKAARFRDMHSKNIDTKVDLDAFFAGDGGGYAYARWCGKSACDDVVKKEHKVSIRCVPNDADADDGPCVVCGDAATGPRVVFAKAY